MLQFDQTWKYAKPLYVITLQAHIRQDMRTFCSLGTSEGLRSLKALALKLKWFWTCVKCSVIKTKCNTEITCRCRLVLHCPQAQPSWCSGWGLWCHKSYSGRSSVRWSVISCRHPFRQGRTHIHLWDRRDKMSIRCFNPHIKLVDFIVCISKCSRNTDSVSYIPAGQNLCSGPS